MLINLTPHVITIRRPEGDLVLDPSGVVARVSTTQIVVDTIDGVDVVKTEFGQVEGLPEPKDGVIYITSSLVAQAVAGQRNDVVAPDTGPTAIRDEGGRIIAVRRLQTF